MAIHKILISRQGISSLLVEGPYGVWSILHAQRPACLSAVDKTRMTLRMLTGGAESTSSPTFDCRGWENLNSDARLVFAGRP